MAEESIKPIEILGLYLCEDFFYRFLFENSEVDVISLVWVVGEISRYFGFLICLWGLNYGG